MSNKTVKMKLVIRSCLLMLDEDDVNLLWCICMIVDMTCVMSSSDIDDNIDDDDLLYCMLWFHIIKIC